MCFPVSYAGFFATHNNLFFIFHFFMYACHRSRMTARVKRHTPTNGSGKNLAKNTGIKYVFCDYPMPDSSLLIITCFFIFYFFMYACHRSRMTARVKRHTRPTGAVRIWQRIRFYFLVHGTNGTKGGIYDKIKLLSFSVKKTSLHKK